MALWGNKDQIGYSKGTIAVNLGTGVITGSGTTFATSGFELNNGDVITVGAGATYGSAVVLSVASNTSVTVASTEFLIADSTATIPAGTSYEISQKPLYSVSDTNYKAPVASGDVNREVFGVDTTEQSVANAASGDARKYALLTLVGLALLHILIVTETLELNLKFLSPAAALLTTQLTINSSQIADNLGDL